MAATEDMAGTKALRDSFSKVFGELSLTRLRGQVDYASDRLICAMSSYSMGLT